MEPQSVRSLREFERRANRRYDLRLPLQYRVSQRGSPSRAGNGMTCDVSTTGIAFRCRRPLPVGAHIEMTVTWPAKNADTFPIELLLTGFVLRSDGGRSAVRVTSRKFRIDALPAAPFRASA